MSFRPPAVPLVTIDPYFSIWSCADHLADDHTRHWTGRRHAMLGVARIDGQPFRFMGRAGLDEPSAAAEPPAMAQAGLAVTPLSSLYRFEAAGVALDVRFTTPLLLDDLDLLSRPASYVTFQAHATDGRPHALRLYLDAAGELAVNTPDQAVTWGRRTLSDGSEALFVGTEEQPILGAVGDNRRIDWGYFYLVAPGNQTAATMRILSASSRSSWLETGRLPESDAARMPRAAGDDAPLLACQLDLGQVGTEGASAFLVLAYDDVFSVEYFGTRLPAYWRRNGLTTDQMLMAAVRDHTAVLARCAARDDALTREAVAAGGDKYGQICAMAYRQAIAAHKLVQGGQGELLFFSKECFSNGCMGTVDVSYPSVPLFLLHNPELVKGMLRPIFRYSVTEAWPFPFAPHDVGCYPKANGQVYDSGDIAQQMPVEECGNMLIMATATYLADGDASLIQANWDLLTTWADYLAENGFDPGNQLCTDDFAGHLARNANLSIKAIVGIGSYALLCDRLGHADSAARYRQIAVRLAAEWEQKDRADAHYKLTFDGPAESWSIKYNLLWDVVFGLGLFPAEIAQREIVHYLTRINRYGLPLDSRATYTKADWLVWVAALAERREDWDALIAPLWDMLNESSSRVPFTDWYDTVTGRQEHFQHRSVVAGVWAKVLQARGLR
ncbi:MAG: glutaminase family protein [Anaerolineae bacterium]